ncbi:hypothetical protein B0T18DRAFT_327692 [Schizothecium vesticola]|uniref:Tyrosinase copper-binding domain-containing protein n=1 Tax=Schizothecium vesticola TaxID=314040 RepID=A0AA40K261_9PEZI|nr:hypothetical protein B0T18DRAFT_327692 [Schizothecium vesticola]
MGKLSASGIAYWAVVLFSWQAAAQQATPVPVVGVQAGIDPWTGQRPARQNINDLYLLGGPQWDLYILALAALQDANEDDELSYFGISGIHGTPHRAWNGVEQVPGGSKSGYCPHGDILFPTWHRAYVLLFEQTLVSHAVRIAKLYPSSRSPTYQAAAQVLRQPFWDWASQPALPVAVTIAHVTVTGPEGPVTIRNPLYNYGFRRKSDVKDLGFGQNTTLRCPGTDGNNATESDRRMANVASHLKTQVWDVFARTKTFEDMTFDSHGGASFENPHGLVHNEVGCGNTMGNIDHSAFDPIFMLHHCNVDRLVALWQAINPSGPMFTTVHPSTGQFGTAPGTNLTADSPLKPFFAEEGGFLTSNMVSDIRKLGYTYPEIDDWSTTPENLERLVRSRINTMYGETSSNLDAGPTQRRGQRNRYSPPARTRQYYVAEIQVNRSEIVRPSAVNLVLDGVIVGRMSLLEMPRTGLASASVPLRDLVVGNRSVTDMAASEAISLLQQRLEMEIRLSDGAEISVDTVPSLELEIQGMTYVPSLSADRFPRFGGATRRPVAVHKVVGPIG